MTACETHSLLGMRQYTSIVSVDTSLISAGISLVSAETSLGGMFARRAPGALLLDYVPPKEPPSTPLGNALRIR